jgi:hypothetical protein
MFTTRGNFDTPPRQHLSDALLLHCKKKYVHNQRFTFFIHARALRSPAVSAAVLIASGLPVKPFLLPPPAPLPPPIIVTATIGCCVRLSARNTAINGALMSPRERACQPRVRGMLQGGNRSRVIKLVHSKPARDKHQSAAHNAAYHLINTPLNLLFHHHCAGPSRQPRARCSNHSVNVCKLRLQVSFCGISGAFGQVGSGGRGGRMLIRSRGSRWRRRHQASLNGGMAHEEALMDRMVSVAGQTSLKSEVKKTFL